MPITRIQVVALLVSLAIVALIAWHYASVPSVPSRPSQGAEAWELPSVPVAETKKAIEALARTNPWGNVQPPAQSGPSGPPRWRILGTFSRGTERTVLVKVDGKSAEHLRIGDALPGGSQIVEIRDDSLCILIEGVQRLLGIHPQGPQVL